MKFKPLILAGAVALTTIAPALAEPCDSTPRQLLGDLDGGTMERGYNLKVFDVVGTVTSYTTTDHKIICRAHLMTSKGELKYDYWEHDVGNKTYMQTVKLERWDSLL